MVSNRSNGIYRSVIATIVGLILIGAAPNKNGIDQPNQPPSQNPVTDQLKDVVAAIKESKKSPQPDNGCKAGQDDRSSDLCAQWKAADAAKDAAWWTFFAAITTVVGVIIGGFTLIAAGFAAKYAKKAADHTQSGAQAALESVTATKEANAIARQIGRAQVTSYVSVKGVQLYIEKMGLIPHIAFSLVNAGSSPAINPEVKVSIAMNLLDKSPVVWEPELKASPSQAIGANTEIEITEMAIDLSEELQNMLIANISTNVIHVMLKVDVIWTDVFGITRTWQEIFSGITDKAYKFGSIIQMPTVGSLNIAVKSAIVRGKIK